VIGSTVTFECIINGQPQPKVEWLKGDVVLTNSEKTKISVTEGGRYSLVIYNVESSDAGLYTVTASNEAGVGRCTATLLVTEADQGGDTVTSRSVTQTEKTVTVIQSTEGTAPSFVQFMRSLAAAIGSDATFECSIIGDPAPQITWSKNKLTLKESDRIHITATGDKYSMTIRSVTSDDAGQYTVTAANDSGEISCTATLNVHEAGEDVRVVHLDSSDTFPSFTQFLKSQIVKEGDSVTLQCAVSCSTTPEVTWTKAGVKLGDTERRRISASSGGEYKLTISNVQQSDQGEYTVTVSTEGGELACTASIVIQAEGSQIVTKTSTVVHKSTVSGDGDDGETIITKTSSSSSSHSSSSHSVIQTGSDRQYSITSQRLTGNKSFGLSNHYKQIKGAPNIDKFPKSQFAAVGGSVTFSCHITCDPPPKVTWSRDGVPLTESENISFSAVDGQYSLTVKNIDKDSGGDFTIVAANDFGELSCTASLFVTEATMEIIEGEESVEEYESEDGAESDDESE